MTLSSSSDTAMGMSGAIGILPGGYFARLLTERTSPADAGAVERVARAASGETTWRWENGVTPYERSYWLGVARRVICELEEPSA